MDLDTVRLGDTGTRVSELALGTARFGNETEDGEEIDRETAHALLDRYAEAGGNVVDTADAYGDGTAEEYVGDWLADRERDDFVLASKIYWPTREDPNARGLSRKHLRESLDNILERLGTEYLDLLYVHRWDDDTPDREFLRTLDGFVEDGRVHYLGASNRAPNAWQVARGVELARREGWEPFAATQMPYSLVDRALDSEYLDMVEHYGLGLFPYSPLAGGFLTGKYDPDDVPAGSRADRDDQFADQYLTKENFQVLDAVRDVAREADCSALQVSLAWLARHEAVTAPVVGPRTVEQLEANLSATEVSLTDDQFEHLADAHRDAGA